MPGSHELNRDVDIDLTAIFGSIWRHKFTLLIAAAAMTFLALIVLQAISPRYTSEASILIRTTDSVLSEPSNAEVSGQPAIDDQAVASQVQLLMSRAIAQKIVTKLNLADLPEFDTSMNPSAISQFLSMFGLMDSGQGVTSTDRALESYYEKLSVFQADRARVIVVRFWSNDPELAAKVPNMITDEYMALQEELKRGTNPEELEKIEPELRELRNSVMKAEAAVAEFRENSDLLQGRDNNSLATQELSELSTELGRVRVQLSRADANAASIRAALKSGTLDEATSVLQSPLIQRLRERQVTLKSQLSELSTTLLSGHPRVQRLKSQVNTLNSQIESEALKIEASLQREAEVARAREADLIQRRNVLKSEAGRVGKAQVELRALEREADAQRQLLNTYLVRFKEAQSRQNREYLPADAFVFSKAEVPSQPYFPKKLPTLAGVFFGTLLLGSTVTLASTVLSGTAIRQVYASESDVVAPPAQAQQAQPVQKVAAPPLAPTASTLDSRHDFNPQQQSAHDNVVSVSVAVKSVSLLGQGRVVVLTPETDCRALTAVVLARSLAAKPSNAVLVDVSGSAVSSKAMLGHTNASGIMDVLSGATSLSEAIHCDRTSAAHIMPCGNTSAEAAAGSAAQLPMILDALQQTYEFVIIDCGNADIGGLSRVSNASTLMLIDAVNPNNPFINVLGDMLTQAGYKYPIIVKATAAEQDRAGLTSA